MIFCKSHSNCGQKIVFLDLQICFGQEDSPHGAFLASRQLAQSLRSYVCNIFIAMHKSPLPGSTVGKKHCVS